MLKNLVNLSTSILESVIFPKALISNINLIYFFPIEKVSLLSESQSF